MGILYCIQFAGIMIWGLSKLKSEQLSSLICLAMSNNLRNILLNYKYTV